ncbi:MAG: hypothetical protein JJ896_14200 [Rhodothermales bacterium]|nr:hypothetical protein [Rhodothermales bacterium]MBO6780801.1 hypothetical protein [Rhodothermales bacterium]
MTEPQPPVEPALEKMDLQLRRQLASAASNQVLPVLVRLKGSATDEHLMRVTETGVRFSQVSELILSVRGVPREIGALSRLDFVERMEGSRRVTPGVRR